MLDYPLERKRQYVQRGTNTLSLLLLRDPCEDEVELVWRWPEEPEAGYPAMELDVEYA